MQEDSVASELHCVAVVEMRTAQGVSAFDSGMLNRKNVLIHIGVICAPI